MHFCLPSLWCLWYTCVKEKVLSTLYNTSGIEKVPHLLDGSGPRQNVLHAWNGPEWTKYEICLSIEHTIAHTRYNYQVPNMTSRLSSHFSIFDLVFFVFKSLLRIARQWSHVKFAILTLKPRSHVRIILFLIYIECGLVCYFISVCI